MHEGTCTHSFPPSTRCTPSACTSCFSRRTRERCSTQTSVKMACPAAPSLAPRLLTRQGPLTQARSQKGTYRPVLAVPPSLGSERSRPCGVLGCHLPPCAQRPRAWAADTTRGRERSPLPAGRSTCAALSRAKQESLQIRRLFFPRCWSTFRDANAYQSQLLHFKA